MKVKKLIAKLSQLDPELPAYLRCLKCKQSEEVDLLEIETAGCVYDPEQDFEDIPSECGVDNKFEDMDAGSFPECDACVCCLPYRVELI
jgi:hypothetical protein